MNVYTKKTIDLESLPADIIIYRKRIFVCSEAGFVEILLKNKFPSKLSYRFWDEKNVVSNHPFTQISSASYGYVLLSGLSDGIWQYALGDYDDGNQLRQVSSFHSSYITREYNDFLTGSYVNDSYLIKRNVVFGDKNDITDDEHRSRKTSFGRSVSLNKWFGVNDGFYFSRNYLVYCIANGHIYSSTKNKILSDNENNRDSIVEHNANLPNRRVLEAQVEVFGLVIEYDNCIIVLFADGSKKTISFNGRKLTSWRTFPESKNYLNQLHLIFENEIEIHSFNGPAITAHREFGFNYKYGAYE